MATATSSHSVVSPLDFYASHDGLPLRILIAISRGANWPTLYRTLKCDRRLVLKAKACFSIDCGRRTECLPLLADHLGLSSDGELTDLVVACLLDPVNRPDDIDECLAAPITLAWHGEQVVLHRRSVAGGSYIPLRVADRRRIA